MMYLRLFKRFVQIGFDVTINELEIVEFFLQELNNEHNNKFEWEVFESFIDVHINTWRDAVSCYIYL